MLRPVIFLISLAAWAIRALFISRSELLAENVALRQQVCALKRDRPVLATLCIRVSTGSDDERLCRPMVLVMKPAENRDRDDLSAGRGD